MGSDMAMEREVVRTWAEWEMEAGEQRLFVYKKSSFYDVKNTIWTGTAEEVKTESVQSLLKLLVKTIPERPEPVIPLKTRLKNLLLDEVRGYDTEFFEDKDWDAIVESIMEEING